MVLLENLRYRLRLICDFCGWYLFSGGSEFCNVVSKIHIYTQEEVEKMTIGLISDDTQSCLEQAPVVMEASKSSSVGQPDSSPTVIRV